MPKYKLTYFDARSRAEISRLLFAAAGVEYEDERIEVSEWNDFKNKTPLGQLPILEIDGVKYPQSVAFHRYLAKIFGFSGSNDLETLQCDVIVDTCNDLRVPYIFDMNCAKYFEDDAEKVEAFKQRLFNEGLPKFLPVFEKFLSDYGSGSGYAVGSKLTYGDFAIYEILESPIAFWPDILKKYPKLTEHRKLVESNPRVKAYLDKRRKTFG